MQLFNCSGNQTNAIEKLEKLQNIEFKEGMNKMGRGGAELLVKVAIPTL